MSLFPVVQRLLDKAGTSFIEPRREDGHGSSASTPSFVQFPSAQAVRDAYTGGEVLPDQAGAGASLTFTFSSPVQLVYVFARSAAGGSISRADPFGGTPAASAGIPCDDGVPQAIPVTTSTVKVFAPSGVTVSVWGYRYG